MSLQASYQLVNTWASGFMGEITLTNTGTEPIVDWRLPFTFSQEIEDIWRADIVSRDGASYTLMGKDYSDTIAPSESQTISFKAAGAPVEPVFDLAGDAGEAPAAPTPAQPDPIVSPGAVNGDAPDGPVGQPGTDDGPAPANGVNVINVAAGTSAADLQAIIDDAPDGATVWVGKNAFQNADLTFNRAGSDDLWLHARAIPGAHVIIPTAQGLPSEEDVFWAAAVAAYYSKARHDTSVEVDVTLKKFVRAIKGAAPGLVTYRNESTLRVVPEMPEVED